MTLQRKFGIAVLALFLAQVAVIIFAYKALAAGPSQLCNGAVRMNIGTAAAPDYVMDLDGDTAERTITFTMWDAASGGYDVLAVEMVLTDANTSITSLVATCTVGIDKNTITAAPHVCDDTADGNCTQTAGGVFTKASPGSIRIPYTMGTSGWPYVKCVWSVGAGTAASVDDATFNYRMCVGG